MGDNSMSQLGRSTRNVDPKTFGPVPMAEPILAVASGAAHCLAMTADKVFAFGYDSYGETGVGRRGPVKEPTEIYRGTGDAAPVQVEAGDVHSAILTNDGKVRTFGHGGHGSTGHGGTDSIYKPTPIKGLKEKVEQIGCTAEATFFLAGGKMFGCGYNSNSSLGVGHNKAVTVPTLVNTEGHNITSFRCSRTLVVAYTELRDALVWGLCRDNVVIKVPQIEHLEFPRDFFSNGPYGDSVSAVHPEMKDLSSKMLELKMERTGGGARYGQGGVTSQERKAERLAEHGRLVEENSTLHTQLTPVEEKRVPLETKSTQQPTENENLRAKYKALLSDNESLKTEHDDEKKRHNKLKAERRGEMLTYEKLLAEHKALKKENASIQHMYMKEKGKYDTMKTAHQDMQSNCNKLQKKLESLSKLISLPLLHLVVNMVGKKWERLGIRLGVPDFMLEQIDHVCLNLPDKALATINKWYELAPEEATVKNLADCLEYIERKDIADKIRTIE